MPSKLADQIIKSPHPIPMPIGVYAGLELINAKVIDVVTSAQAQSEAILALHERFQMDILMTAMDLSVEAEMFGCEIRMDGDEIPTVIGRKISSVEEIAGLSIPEPNSDRAEVQLQTVENLVRASENPVLGSIIGPFSLAGRLFGLSEILELSITEPETLEKIMEKVTVFLIQYALAFRAVNAAGVIMAEPAAGLLSPKGLSRFSSKYIKQMSIHTSNSHFSIVYHNCGARIVHLNKILEADLEIYHFSTPMDIPEALSKVDENIILSGNLDPTNVFLTGSPEMVHEKTNALLRHTSQYPNFMISSGCDIPPHTPIENLDAFFETVRGS
ncbi:MAG: uroporphyrinogen decarboxylase family protein [Chloroflexota bacterium]|nr:uroporphyrinogen decarboxylase family protein [Chloroflexota bacterium]